VRGSYLLKAEPRIQRRRANDAFHRVVSRIGGREGVESRRAQTPVAGAVLIVLFAVGAIALGRWKRSRAFDASRSGIARARSEAGADLVSSRLTGVVSNAGLASIVAQWHVMRIAKAGDVTVLLDGQGGDELLGGYHAFVGFRIADLLRTGQRAAAARELRAYHRGQAHSWLRSARLALVPLIPQSARTRLRQLDKALRRCALAEGAPPSG
jgi:hypothetical protein